mgnify:CR=1 FL=1
MKYNFLPFKNKVNKTIYLVMILVLSLLVVISFNSIYATHCVEVNIELASSDEVPLVVKGSSIANTTDSNFASIKVSTINFIKLNKGMNHLQFELPVPALTKLRHFKFEFENSQSEEQSDSSKKQKLSAEDSSKAVNLQVASVSLKGMKDTVLSNVPVYIKVNNNQSKGSSLDNKTINSDFISLYLDDSFSITNKDKLEIKPVHFYRINYLALIAFSIFIYLVFYLFLRVLISEKQKNNIKTPDLMMIVILVFVLLVPLVGLNYSKDLDRTENRILAKLPSFLTSDKKLNLNFGSELDSYFNDRFGQRHLFIRIKDYIYSFNNVGVAPSAEGKIYGVNDDWYFVDGLLQLKADEKLLSKEKNNLIEVSKHYNCPVYVLIYPFKSYIYNEAISSIYKTPELVILNESDKIAKYFNDSGFDNLKAIDLAPIFVKSKQEYPDRLLYYKDDHHQTEWAAYLAAKSFASSVTGKTLNSIKDPSFEKRQGFMDIYSIEPMFMRGVSYQRLAIRSKDQMSRLKDFYYYLSTTSRYTKQIEHMQKRFRIYEYQNSSPLIDKTVLTVGNSYVANTGRMLAYFSKDTWQYNFYAGNSIETSIYDVDKDLNGKKVDYVVVAYFTNAVMSELEKK